jgi:hypothetical protein
MGFLQRITSFLTRPRPGTGDEHAIVFHVRCGACGEVIRVRADRRWDLVESWDDPGAAYVLRKDVVGVRCNRLMAIQVTFDRRHAILTQHAQGGTFATPETGGVPGAGH